MLDLLNSKFGLLTPTNQIVRDGLLSKRLCYCDCGNEIWIQTCKLTDGHTKSCGCYREQFKKLPPGQAVLNELFADYKSGAARRNLEFSISYEEFLVLINGFCFYCGSPPLKLRKARRKNGDIKYNGIDRVDNNIGYKIENCVSCCFICNRAKGNMILKEFIEWIKKIKNNS